MATPAVPLERLGKEGRSMSISKWPWSSGSDVDTGSEQDAYEELGSESTRYEYAHINKRPRLQSHSPSHSRSQLPQHPYQRGPFADRRWAIEPTVEELRDGEPLWTPPASPLLSPTPLPWPERIDAARTCDPLLMRPWHLGNHGAVELGTRADSTSGAESRGKRCRRPPAVGTRMSVPELKRTLRPCTSSTKHARTDCGSLLRDWRQRPLPPDVVSAWGAQSAYVLSNAGTRTDTDAEITTDVDDGTGSDESTSDSSSGTEDELCTPHQAINHFSTARQYRTSSYKISPFPSSSGLSSPVPVRSQGSYKGNNNNMHTVPSVFLTDDRWQVELTEEEMQAGRKVGMWDCDLDEAVDADLNGGLELDLGPAGRPTAGFGGHDASREQQRHANESMGSIPGPARTRRSARLTSSQMQMTPTHPTRPTRTTRATPSATSQQHRSVLSQSQGDAKRRRLGQQSLTPSAVPLSAAAGLRSRATGRSPTPARTPGTAYEWRTSPRRRLWPLAPNARVPASSRQRSRGEPDMDGWNVHLSSRPSPHGWASNAAEDDDDDGDDADFEYIRPLARSISSTFTSRASPTSQAPMRQVSDQARHVGTHLSAKYGLADMFQHAQSLLGRCAAGAIRGADTDRPSGVIDQSGETNQVGNGLGGLSFFLGCPKRHPTLNIASPTAAHDRHGSSCRLDGELGRPARCIFEPADERAGEAGAERGEGGSAGDAWTSKIAELRAGVAELEKHSPGFSQRIFVHSHETGNLALAPQPTAAGPTSRRMPQSRDKEALSAHAVMLDGYRAQMEMMAAAGLRNLVIHPGAAKDLDAETACKDIANNLDVLLAEYPTITVVMESMTCGPRGTLLGTSLPSLASIRALSAYPERVKYCLDLCHVHSASHDLSTESGRGRFEIDVERYLGRENVVLVHVSECGVVSGSGGDLHRPFGQGYIGSHGIRQILRSRLFNHMPRPSGTALTADRCADQLGAHTSVDSRATGPVIIIETPRYLPPSITSSRVQALETRRAALDLAYLHKLSSWDDATYHSQWHEWENHWYRPRMAALRVQMRRCIAPGSGGEVGMEDRIKEGRKVRAKLGRWRKRLPRTTGETRGSLDGGSEPDQP